MNQGPKKVHAAEMSLQMIAEPQVLVIIDADSNPEEFTKSLNTGTFAIDTNKTKGGFLVDGKPVELPGIYNPVTHYFTLENPLQLRDFARKTSEYSKLWPAHCFFIAVNGEPEGLDTVPSNQCLLMIIDEDDVDEVSEGCPPNGLYAVVKDGMVVTSSDHRYDSGSASHFSMWLFPAS